MNESNSAIVPNATLIRQATKRDPGALATLLGRHQSLIFSVCMRLLGHRQDAEDMTQETLTRIAKHIDRVDPMRPFEPWVVTVAGNRCRSLLARRSRVRSRALAEEPACDKPRLEHDADGLREEINHVVNKLPANHRKAFELFYVESMGYADIADRLDCPVGTVKTWVHRARQVLIEELQSREVVTTRPRRNSGATLR